MSKNDVIDVGTKSLTVDQEAIPFSLCDNNNQLFSLDSVLGESIILLYFYPKDNTPGCTLQAENFRDLNPQFERANIKVIGISKDGVNSHKRFVNSYDLNFTLLSDPDCMVIKSYGVWVEKARFGKKYMGTERSSFLIGVDGKIKRVWRSVKVKGHAQEVLDYVENNLK